MNEIASLVAATLSAGTPLLLAATGVVVSEKSGVVNLGIEGMLFTPGKARFGVVGDPFGTVAPNGSAQLGVTTATLPDTVSSELGLLMMYRRNAGQEADAVRIR